MEINIFEHFSCVSTVFRNMKCKFIVVAQGWLIFLFADKIDKDSFIHSIKIEKKSRKMREFINRFVCDKCDFGWQWNFGILNVSYRWAGTNKSSGLFDKLALLVFPRISEEFFFPQHCNWGQCTGQISTRWAGWFKMQSN